MLKNRILVVMFASAFFAAVATAGWMAAAILFTAGASPGNIVCLGLGAALGSAWPDLFSKSHNRSTQAGWCCLFSVLFFFLSYLFSYWQIWVDTTLMFQ